MLEALLSRPAAQALPTSAGDALSRFGGDSDELGIFAIWSPVNVARWLFAAPAIGLMISINVPITLGIAVPLALLVGLSRLTDERLVPYRARNRQAAGRVSSVLRDVVSEARFTGNRHPVLDAVGRISSGATRPSRSATCAGPGAPPPGTRRRPGGPGARSRSVPPRPTVLPARPRP